MMTSHGTALVRRPSPRLADGLLTYQEREPVDAELAVRQHEAFRAALDENGWPTLEIAPLDDAPDGVFIEDTAVVVDDLAILTRPGTAQRRPEVPSTAAALRGLGLRTVAIEEPGVLEGGDVLQVGQTVYVGRGTRTNAEGIRQLRRLLAPLGRTIVPVRLGAALHLKSALTALPDGTFVGRPDVVEHTLFPASRRLDEPTGAHLVPLDHERVLLAASAPKTADQLADLGFSPVVVDISEFEKLEGCVTCLTVLVADRKGGQP